MNLEIIREHCLSLRGTTEDQAFGPDHILFRIGQKIFCCIDLNRPQLVTVKCDPDLAIELRDRFQGIKGAFHWNKRHWNDIHFETDVDDHTILSLINKSYELIIRSFPKKSLYYIPELPSDWYHEHHPTCSSAMSIARNLKNTTPSYSLITTDFQTAGRGQGNNSWESASACNLLFALRLSPTFLLAQKQFLLSQVVAVSIARALQHYLGQRVNIKWPNDIYINEHKICGILIEHTLFGPTIKDSIIGVGINVNQAYFESDAPNPISIRQILGKEIDRAALLRHFLKHFTHVYSLLQQEQTEKVQKDYWKLLYRKKGYFPYTDSKGLFEACIHDILPNGCIVLKDTQGLLRTYAHKEVAYVL